MRRGSCAYFGGARSWSTTGLGRTIGKDICTELINCVSKKLAYSFTNLVAICADGAPAMYGKPTGAVSLIQKVIERRLITHHCTIHQQAFLWEDLKI